MLRMCAYNVNVIISVFAAFARILYVYATRTYLVKQQKTEQPIYYSTISLNVHNIPLNYYAHVTK